uniref:Uncharacterized protein n=1 Tax=Medicago truncatula TaxID=3880 RepID=I3SBD6_MEDTR|nr:unknown [Medicago truncatula]
MGLSENSSGMKMVSNLIGHHHLMIKKILFLLKLKPDLWLSFMAILSTKALKTSLQNRDMHTACTW